MGVIVSEGLSFAGSTAVRQLVSNTAHTALNVDARNRSAIDGSIRGIEMSKRYRQSETDIYGRGDGPSLPSRSSR